MNRSSRISRAIALILAEISAGSILPRPGTAAESASPRSAELSLFNGTNLNGFYTWLVDTRFSDPHRVFTVADRMLRISGDGLGYVATTNEFENYHLVAEYKWGQRNWPWGTRLNAARDSGIFLHSIGADGSSEDGKGAFRAAIECNIFEGATGDFLLIRSTNSDGTLIAPRISAEIAPQKDSDGWPYWQKGGPVETIARWGRLNWFGKDHAWKDVTGFRGRRDFEKPAGEWNRIECVCDRRRITVILNGMVVNEVFDVFPSRGKILLQCEGSEIFFRRLDLRPLSVDHPANTAP